MSALNKNTILSAVALDQQPFQSNWLTHHERVFKVPRWTGLFLVLGTRHTFEHLASDKVLLLFGLDLFTKRKACPMYVVYVAYQRDNILEECINYMWLCWS